MISSQIRQAFLSFFKNHNHHIEESSSIIPFNDNSLLFVNSGMVPFKEYFLSLKETKYKRIASCQKSIRVGGKHNDLENVGYTNRHHTFFEMLGNFSFGDYFKEEAIFYAWNFLTKELQLNKNDLFITIYYTDEESYKLWKKIANIDDYHIFKNKNNDNFWQMANEGPCGPSSEIFFDYKTDLNIKSPLDDQEGKRFVEIWNLVFMEFNKIDNKLHNLDKKSVDTGMGLERITSVMQGKINNYESDIFNNLIIDINNLTK